MRTFLEVRPIQVTDEEIAKQYLAKCGLVAIKRTLAEELAKTGAGSLMAYDTERDRYGWRIQVIGGTD